MNSCKHSTGTSLLTALIFALMSSKMDDSLVIITSVGQNKISLCISEQIQLAKKFY